MIEKSINVEIPFYGGDATLTQISKKENRLEYLYRTVLTAKLCFLNCNIKPNIRVHVCNTKDEMLLKTLFNNLFSIHLHNVENSIFLPATTVNFLKETCKDDDLFFYTEGDQLLTINNINNILNTLKENVYIVPHRLEEVSLIHRKVHHLNNHEFFNINDRLYLAQNRSLHNGNVYEENSAFYKPENCGLGFGGCYFVLGKSLKKVSVSFTTHFAIEHPSGFDLFNKLLCLKTKDIKELFVIHLSGYELSQRNKNFLIPDNIMSVINK